MPIYPSVDAEYEETNFITIEDPYLEWNIRAQLDKPSEPLTKQDLQSVKGISAQDLTISSLNGLEHATNLEILHLNNNNISDLGPLQTLENIKTLSLEGNNIIDLQPLESLINLEQLNISKNQITDLSILHDKLRVKELYASDNEINDITFLSGLKNLEVINLDGNKVTSLAPLNEHSLIKRITILDNPINIFTDDLSSSVTQKFLDLGATVIGNDNTVVEVPDPILEDEIRQQINKTDGEINKGDMSRVEELLAVNKGIRRLEGLEQAVNLRLLNMDQNMISDLGPINSLEKVEQLEVLDNQIVDLSPIAGFKNLTALDVGSNEIRSLSPLSNLTKIKELTISDNQVSDLSGITNLEKLEWLDLESNKIKDLTPLTELSSLELLDISDNEITDMRQITSLKISDDIIEFKDNPVSAFEQWPKEVEESTVPINKKWVITFNKKLNEDSINNYTVYVENGGSKVDTELVVLESGESLKLLPPIGGYDSGVTYEIHITKGVKTLDGQYLEQPIIKTFTVENDEVRNPFNLIVQPTLSERKLLKFAHLAYYDFHKLGDNRYSIHDALQKKHGILRGTLQKKWEKDYKKVNKNINKFNKSATAEDKIKTESLIEMATLTEVNNWDFVDVKNTADGFYAVAFQSPDQTKTVIAYRGSDNPLLDKRDWLGANFFNLLKTHNSQIHFAIEFAQLIKEEYPSTSIYLTGHSLGGWLAQRVAAEEIDVLGNGQFKKAVTFNAPGFSEPWEWPAINGNYLSTIQWNNNIESPIYKERIDNIFITKDFVGTFRTHLGTDITFPINHILSGIWGLKWHGILNFYYPGAYLSSDELNDTGFSDTTIIRDLWKSDFHKWYDENRPVYESAIEFMELPVKYDKPFDLILRKTPNQNYEEKAFKFKLPEEVTLNDKLLITPKKMSSTLNVRIYNTDTTVDPRSLDPLFEERFYKEAGPFEVDISQLEPGKHYYLFLNGESNDVFQMVFASQGLGTISGKVINALTGHGESGLSLEFRKGTEDQPGEIVETSMTGVGGYYSIDLPGGQYVMEVSGEGFVTKAREVTSPGNGEEKGNQNISISPLLPEGEVRIILEWGISPSDLDSHLTGPAINSDERFHIYYWNRRYGDLYNSHASLDVDVVTSYGPETITVKGISNGTYRYSVHDYTNRLNTRDSRALSESGAKVRVIFSDGREETFYVPANTPGTLWTVFEISNNRLIPINRLSMVESPSSVQSVQVIQQDDSDLIYQTTQNNPK